MLSAGDVCKFLRVPGALSADACLRKHWLASQSRPCKDVVALAIPLRSVPTTLDAFRQALADSGKGGDWVLTSWYLVHVGAADGREWGWSNAPYDQKKRLPDTKPLYGLDSDGQTRFWSFKKVSNNMNKGPRVEDQEDEKLSFGLPGGTCFTHFVREDSYGDKPLFLAGASDLEQLPAFAPALLQLSSTNSEQTSKGNGLKLRRVLPLPAGVLSSFHDKFHTRVEDLAQAQQRAHAQTALSNVAKPVSGCPLVCKVDRSGFWFYDEQAQVVEILDSLVDPEMGNKLLVPQDMLLLALHSDDLRRALNMLTVAIGHGAVSCIVTPSTNEGGGVCRVVHLHVDLTEAMWLNLLQSSRNGPEFPVTSALTMCFGRSLSGSAALVLQWFSPSCRVPMADADGGEAARTIIFEMDLASVCGEGSREVRQKALLMDGVSGQHYVIKIFHAAQVLYAEGDPEVALSCDDLKPLMSWQFRPGLGLETSAGTTRKRQLVQPDARDSQMFEQLQGPAKVVRFADSDAAIT